MTDELVLTGLDGTNPLGYLAALGTLRVLSENGVDARLSWRLLDAWRPVLRSEGLERDGLLDVLKKDVEAWRRDAPELELAYEKTTKSGTRSIYELKPPPAVFQAYAASAVEQGRSGMRRWADYVAAYAAAHAGLGVDNGGYTKPTALHFTAGKLLFVEAVRKLVGEVQPDDLQEALFGPWRYERTLPVLGWDVLAGERDYALRATDPSSDKKAGIPGADWLGFRGMAFFPVVLRDGVAVTTGFEGRGKRYIFHWALWDQPLSADVAKTMVAARWDRATEVERRARGIALVLKSRVRRTDQGGYGSFAAASPS